MTEVTNAMDVNRLLLPTLIYGSKKPEIRFRMHEGQQRIFCLTNGSLHLTEKDLDEGTYETGAFLGGLCREHCTPTRDDLAPCPAFVRSWRYGTENKGLASVEMHAMPQWKQCGGVGRVLELAGMTNEEEFFFLAYLDSLWTDKYQWRDHLVKQWNAYWHLVPNGWGTNSRRCKFDRLLWATVRYPALIPQVWLNWLHAAPEPLLRTLDSQASRVDFVAFAHGKRHVIEIDGPSHYATWNGTAYEPDEKEYARNLKIERWLRAEAWEMMRIGRWEVRQAMADDLFGTYDLVALLRFGKNYPEPLGAEWLGVLEIDRALPTPKPVTTVDDFPALPADDDIPF